MPHLRRHAGRLRLRHPRRRAPRCHRAHREATSLLDHAYVLFTVGTERDRHLLVLEPEAWPADWRSHAWPTSTQRIGTRWAEDQESVVLQVPSAIVPEQHNYLVNPQHPHFGELKISGPAAFDVDPRLGG